VRSSLNEKEEKGGGKKGGKKETDAIRRLSSSNFADFVHLCWGVEGGGRGGRKKKKKKGERILNQ